MYKIVIPGRPVPKGRPRFSKAGHAYTPRRTREYEELVGWKVREIIKEPIKGDVTLHIKVYVKRNVFPDLDNIAKSIQDGMNKIAYYDDKQISYLTVQRIHGEEEKVEVEIEEVS
ncbi:RusA family crossover junction endodeoxyribonuclease [Thermoanaerobacterium thermosaccharolyticum]|uniref:RusA family crossover junction endodeoxyribonuclease n=1 Tax=Thermoanaerobacterium thermosaccharolyticum TaxID=1517 RepID=UPI003D2A5BDC